MKRSLRVALLALALGVFALAAWSHFPLCPVAGTLGIPCPGCGLTRATLALLQGNVAQALHFHPLVWLLTPLFVGFMLSAMLELVLGPSPRRRAPLVNWNNRQLTVAASLVLALSLGVWLARFAGYLGGPVPVMSLRDWLASRH